MSQVPRKPLHTDIVASSNHHVLSGGGVLTPRELQSRAVLAPDEPGYGDVDRRKDQYRERMRMRISIELVADERHDERDGHRKCPELFAPEEIDQEDFQNAV